MMSSRPKPNWRQTLQALCLIWLLGAAPAFAQSGEERARAVDLFRRLVAYDTSVNGAQTAAMASDLAGQFRAAGFGEDDVSILTTSGTNSASSLLVRYRGREGGRPAILVVGHLDVVVAFRSDWERDPFTLVEENGFFYGRGALDNKSSIALIVTTLLSLRQQGYRPRRDIVLWLSGDSETHERATRELLAEHRALLGDVALALNAGYGGAQYDAERNITGYELQTAEMSVASFTLEARNPGGHSSRPSATNAIYDLTDALERIRAARGACVPTMISGGHAMNALPQFAQLTLNCRFLPGISSQDVLLQIQRLAGSAEVTFAEPAIVGEPSPPREDLNAALAAAFSAIGHGDIEILPHMIRGATEGRFLRAAGIPTYGVSEAFIHPDDNFAHGLNERYPVESFNNGLTYWRVLMTRLADRR